jgi:hypothetical protein
VVDELDADWLADVGELLLGVLLERLEELADDCCWLWEELLLWLWLWLWLWLDDGEGILGVLLELEDEDEDEGIGMLAELELWLDEHAARVRPIAARNARLENFMNSILTENSG